MKQSQQKPQRSLHQKAVAGALQSHTRGLVSSSALTAVPGDARLFGARTGSSLAAGLFSVLLMASTLAAPLVLAPVDRAMAEDLAGTPGAGNYASGGGNGGGGDKNGSGGAVSHDGGGGGGALQPPTGSLVAGGDGGSAGSGGGTAGAGIGGGGAGGTSGSKGGDSGGGDGIKGGGGGVGALEILANKDKIKGGDGGAGMRISNDNLAGGGGGAGLYLRSGYNATTHSGLVILGGDGGAGAQYSTAGGGGAGALVNGTLTNKAGASITGGKGGDASPLSASGSDFYGGGGGGDGVAIVGVGSHFENYGTVTGGDGGTSTVNPQMGANAGAGIRLGHDATVVNAGKVRAGQSHGTGDPTSAIMIVGNNAKLELRGGSDVQGGITVASGVTGAELIVGGADNGVVNTGMTGTNGFESFTKTGSSSWTMTGNIIATNVTISQGSLILDDGGAFSASSLENNGTFAVNYSTDQNYATSITGNGSFSKMGRNTLTLSGNNTFASTVKVEAGTLKAGSTGAFGTGAATLDVFTGATADLGGFDATVGGLEGGGTVALGAKSLTLNIDGANTTTTYTGTMTGSDGSSLTKKGAGALIVEGNIGASAVTISDGRLQVNTGGSLSKASSITDNGILAFNMSGGNPLEVGAKITGSGGFSQFGPTTVILTANNDYSGLTTIGAGSTLQVGNGGDTGSIGTGPLSNSGTLSFDRSDRVTLSGELTGSGGLEQKGRGTLILTADNDYSGATTIASGSTLQLGAGGNTGSIAFTSDITDNGTLAVNRSGSFTIQHAITGTGGLTQMNAGTIVLTGANSYQGTTTIASGGTLQLGMANGTSGSLEGGGAIINNGTLDINRSGNDVVLSSAISGGGKLVQDGAGKTILTGNNTYNGTTEINNGVLQIGNNGTTGNIAQGSAISNKTQLIVSRSDAYILSASIGGAGQVVKVNNNALTLSGTNSFNGLLDVQAGSVLAGSATAFGNGTLKLASGTTANLNNNDITLKGLDGQGGSTVALGGKKLTLDQKSNTDFGGTMTGAAGSSFVMKGGKTFTATGEIGAENVTIEDGGTFQLGTGGQTGKLGSTNATITNDGNLVVDRSDASTIAAAISGQGNLLVKGGGTLTLSGPSTYDGDTTVEGGSTVAMDHAGGVGAASGQLILDNGALKALASFDLSQDIKLGAGGGAIDTDGAGTTLTLHNTVSGTGSSSVRAATGSLTKSGDGTLAVLNDIKADTDIKAGTLRVGDGKLSGNIDGDINVAAGATLEIDRSNAEIQSNRLNGAGTLKVDGPGAYVLKGDSTGFTGDVETSGSLIIGDNLNASSVTVAQDGSLSGNGSILGDVTVQNLGHLKNQQGETLSIGGSLTLEDGAQIDVALGAPGSDQLFEVAGVLHLGDDNKLNVSSLGDFGAGTYNIIKYDAGYDGTLVLGDLPGTAQPGSFDLHYDNGFVSIDASRYEGTNSYWNGSGTGAGLVGGNGTWNATNTNWSDRTGVSNIAFADNNDAIFQGQGGTVTVDDSGGNVSAGSLVFNVDGYTIAGDAVTLVKSGDGTVPKIRVGDGTLNGSNMVATIESELVGTDGFQKTDFGTAILTKDNENLDGNVTISEGTLQLGNNTATGMVKGDITIGDTPEGYDARLVIDHSADVELKQQISGTGSLVQAGTGKVTITNDDTYQGGTLIAQGDLQLGDGAGKDGSIIGAVDIHGADSHLIVANTGATQFDGIITGQGGLILDSTAKTTLTNNNDYAGETQINDGTLALTGTGRIEGSSTVHSGAGGTFDISGVDGASTTIRDLQGGGTVELGGKTLNVSNGQGSLSDYENVLYSGKITGNGGLEIAGGTLRLTGNDNDYTGGTRIGGQGTLVIGDHFYDGKVQGKITVDGTLIYDLQGDYTINQLDGDGDVKFEGGGNGIIDTKQDFEGTLDIGQDDTLIIKGGGDVSNSGGVNVEGTLDVTEIDADDFRVPNIGGGETGFVDLGEKNLIITDGNGSDFGGVIDGEGGVTIEGGKQIFSGDNTYTGKTLIKPNGELQIGREDKRGSLQSDVTNEGILSGDGSIKDLVNKGKVSPGFGNDKYGTIDVTGDYKSDGGRLVLHESLNGDDNSRGDRLNVAGSTSGTTEVTVINNEVTGLGAPTTNGIKVISVGQDSSGQFDLVGNYLNYRGAQAVVAGAYAYTLEKGGVAGGEGNWYLRSQMQGYKPQDPKPDTPAEDNVTPDNPTPDNPIKPNDPITPEYQAGVPLYSAATSALAAINRTGGFASFNTRFKAGENAGNGQDNSGDGQGQNGGDLTRSANFWSRVQGGYDFYTPSGSATGSTYGTHNWSVEAGVDGKFIEGDQGTLLGSAWFDYTRSRIDTASRVGNGQVTVNGYGVGGALTWYGDNGIYLDGQGKATWYSSDMTSDIANEAVASDVKSFGYALSLEAGKAFTFNDRWSVTPQAQLIWSSLNTDDYDDVFAASVNTPTAQSLTGRIGLAANYATNWQAADGTATRLTLGGVINVYQELKGGSDYIMVSGERVATGSIDKTWGEIGLTANYTWADDIYSVFGKVSTGSSLQNFGDSYSVSGNVGMRVKW